MNRPGHPLSLKSLMMKRTLRELPASSDSKSLLVKALDMEVDNLKAKDASSYTKSPITFSPLSPKFHISVIPKVSPRTQKGKGGIRPQGCHYNLIGRTGVYRTGVHQY